MKRFLNILALAAVVTLTSCNYEPEGWHGTILDVKPSEVVFDTSSINYMFTPEDGTVIEIPVSRGIATEAYTTTIEVLDGEGKPIVGNPDYALMVLEQAKFEVDQYESVATLTFDRRQFTAGKSVPFYLVLPETQIYDDITVCGLKILRDYTWTEFCPVVLVSQFWTGMLGKAEVECIAYKAENAPKYRIWGLDKNGEPSYIDFEFEFIEGTFAIIGEPDDEGDVSFATGISAGGAGVYRFCNVSPELTFYHPTYNAVVSASYYAAPEINTGWGVFQDVWYFDKALVTE